MDRDFYESMMNEAAHTLQGFYGRLYNRYLNAEEEQKKAFCDDLAEHNVESLLDFVMYVEG